MTIDEIIIAALHEDIGPGDYTSLSTIPEGAKGRARLIIKEDGILCGVELAAKVFDKVDPELKINKLLYDGTRVIKGNIAFTVEGSAISILSAERLVLNFMQRLSGIATFTNQVETRLKGLHTRLLDTRKTTPLMRELEKYAVKTGGGTNHRMGLYDMVMIKDNHVDYAGGIVQAIDSAVSYLEKNRLQLEIEIEVRNFDELSLVLKHGKVQRIMLDNFIPSDLARAIRIIDKRFITEASGGISISNIREYAETGVDFISVGALTHQIKSLDMSLKAY